MGASNLTFDNPTGNTAFGQDVAAATPSSNNQQLTFNPSSDLSIYGSSGNPPPLSFNPNGDLSIWGGDSNYSFANSGVSFNANSLNGKLVAQAEPPPPEEGPDSRDDSNNDSNDNYDPARDGPKEIQVPNEQVTAPGHEPDPNYLTNNDPDWAWRELERLKNPTGELPEQTPSPSDSGSEEGATSNEGNSTKEGSRLSREEEKTIRSLERQIAEHEQKLQEYINNPDAFDNQGYLKNAPSEEVRQRIIEGRIRHLSKEIETFKQQITDIRNRHR